MRLRVVPALAVAGLAASLGACSADSSNEPEGPLAAVTQQDPGTDEVSEAADVEGDDVPQDKATCDTIIEFRTGVTTLKRSTAANHQLGDEYVDEVFAPVREIKNDLPLTFQASVIVLERFASVATMPVTDDAKMEQILAQDDVVQAFEVLTDVTRDVCGLPATWGK